MEPGFVVFEHQFREYIHHVVMELTGYSGIIAFNGFLLKNPVYFWIHCHSGKKRHCRGMSANSR